MNLGSNANPGPSVGEAIKRILALETSGVGCGATCACRAYFAISLTPEQSTTLGAHAKSVVLDHKSSDIGAVKELLGESMSQLQTELLDHIATDSSISPYKDERGGMMGALDALSTVVETGDIIGVFGGEGERLRAAREQNPDHDQREQV